MSVRDRILEMRGCEFPKKYLIGDVSDVLASPDLRPATAFLDNADKNNYQDLPNLYDREMGVVNSNLCYNCREHGKFEFMMGNKYCVVGCANCVSDSCYQWGSVCGSRIPCNGSYMGRELSNLELIYIRMILRTNRDEKYFMGLFQELPKRLHYLMEVLWQDISIDCDENWESAMWILRNEVSTAFLKMIEKNFDFTLVKPESSIKNVKNVKWYINYFNRRYVKRVNIENLSWDPRNDPVPKPPKKYLCRRMMDIVEENQGKLAEGDYLKMMNLIRDIHFTEC